MPIFRVFLRWFFSLSVILLMMAFAWRLFMPATTVTAPLVQRVQPIYPSLDAFTRLLASPITLACNSISPLLPAEARYWFPVSPAAEALERVGDLLFGLPGLAGSDIAVQWHGLNLKARVPGVMDWPLLLAISLWRLVETILLRFTEHLESVQHRRRRAEQNERLRQSYNIVTPEAPVTPIRDPGKDVLFRQMVHNLRSEVSTLRNTMHLDPLTQLFNRRYFDERLHADMARARQEGLFLGLIMMDIDDFKRLNDQFGHTAGDAALTQLGLILAQLSPPKGKSTAFRYGGEEMAMLLTDTNPDIVMQMGEAIREQVTQIRLPEYPKVTVTASIGCCTVRFVSSNGSFDLDARSYIAKADAQMYKAKRTGKNRVVAEVLP